jgi:MIP family channel proteins
MFHTSQKLTAEFLGTFALVFFGEGAACAVQYVHGALDVNLFVVALAHGLAIAVFFTAIGQVSGGHFNPAITMGCWATKRMNTIEAATYWVAQIAGAIAAAYLLRALLPEEAWRNVALGTPELVRDFPKLAGMALEGVATFFLVFVFFAATDEDRVSNRSAAGFAIGVAYVLGILVAMPFTTGALNPARAFGPWVATGAHLANQGVYWVGPIAGGFLAGLLYDSLYLAKKVVPD